MSEGGIFAGVLRSFSWNGGNRLRRSLNLLSLPVLLDHVMPERGHIMVVFLADPYARQTLYVIRPAVLSHKFRKRVVFRFCIRARLHRMRKNCGTTAPSGPQHRPGSPHSHKQTTPPPKLPRDPSLYLSRKYCPAPFRENRCLTSAPRLFPNALANQACRSVQRSPVGARAEVHEEHVRLSIRARPRPTSIRRIVRGTSEKRHWAIGTVSAENESARYLIPHKTHRPGV